MRYDDGHSDPNRMVDAADIDPWVYPRSFTFSKRQGMVAWTPARLY